MLVGELRGKVGVAPGTTTLTVPAGPYRTQLVGADIVDPSTLAFEAYLAADIKLRQEQFEEKRRSANWSRVGTIATTSIAVIAVIASLSAWARTGRVTAINP